jgi:hypothetical protein
VQFSIRVTSTGLWISTDVMPFAHKSVLTWAKMSRYNDKFINIQICSCLSELSNHGYR